MTRALWPLGVFTFEVFLHAAVHAESGVCGAGDQRRQIAPWSSEHAPCSLPGHRTSILLLFPFTVRLHSSVQISCLSQCFPDSHITALPRLEG